MIHDAAHAPKGHFHLWGVTTVGTVSGSLARATTLSTEKKTHNLKAENYVLFDKHTEDLAPEDSLSEISRGLSKR